MTAAVSRVCFLRQFSDTLCRGRLVRAHLIPRQTLSRELNASDKVIADPRGWVWACGGPTGAQGHHGELDYSRTLRVPVECLPREFVEWVQELGLGWWLDRWERDHG